MASRSRKRSLHELSREMPTHEEFKAFGASAREMEPRAAALVLAAYLDNLLEIAISRHFVQSGREKYDALFRDRGAPLASFSAKISLGHALAIFDDDFRSQIDRLRAIRNAFAHAMKAVDFNHPDIASECNKLRPENLVDEVDEFVGYSSPKDRFFVAGSIMIDHLIRYTKRRDEDLELGKIVLPVPFRCKFD